LKTPAQELPFCDVELFSNMLVRRLLCVYFLATVLAAQNQSPSTIVLQHANVIDGVSSQPALDVTIVLRDGKIASIGAASPNDSTGAQIIDLAGRWVLPGLIDAHTHVNTISAATAALESGLTTVRVTGAEHYVDIGLRELHRSGMFTIPDIVACGHQIRPDMSEQFILDHPALAALRPKLSGEEGIGRAIKANLDRGVDCIKVLATERAGTSNTDPNKRTFSDSELKAAVRASGATRIAAHAHEAGGVEAAVRAGIHTLEHGTYVTDETLELMKKQGTCFVSTVLAHRNTPTNINPTPAMVARYEQMAPVRADAVRRASKHGVKLVVATDVSYGPPSPKRYLFEDVVEHARLGVSTMDAIKAVTSTAAECIGIEKRTGSVRVGLEADLIIVNDNPLVNINTLGTVLAVINNGRVVKNTLAVR
jgi:imidazolonepropionase-like amidohydrolase